MLINDTWLIIPCAGLGKRFCSKTPKQYHIFNNQSIIDNTYQSLLKVFAPKQTIVPINRNDKWFQKTHVSKANNVLKVKGGSSRQQSVFNALTSIKQIAKKNDWVVVHDAVRPFLSSIDFSQLKRLNRQPNGGHFALQSTDAVIMKSFKTAYYTPLSKKQIYLSQTPQIYRFDKLFKAFNKAKSANKIFDDEASIMAASQLKCIILNGSKLNIKITYQKDLL